MCLLLLDPGLSSHRRACAPVSQTLDEAFLLGSLEAYVAFRSVFKLGTKY